MIISEFLRFFIRDYTQSSGLVPSLAYLINSGLAELFCDEVLNVGKHNWQSLLFGTGQ